jgi:hypothetical protein
LDFAAEIFSHLHQSQRGFLQICRTFLPVQDLPMFPEQKLEVSMTLRKVIYRASLWGLSLTGTMLVVACAGGPLTTREKGTLGGAALGAGTGAIIGGATGSPGTGALIGGALGGLGGAAVGGEL